MENLNLTIVKAGVGQALTSKAPDHVIATTEDVYDPTIGNYQSKINEQTVKKDEDIEFETTDGVASSLGENGYNYNGTSVVGLDDDGDVVVTGEKIAKKGGTNQQILLGNGETASILTQEEIDAILED